MIFHSVLNTNSSPPRTSTYHRTSSLFALSTLSILAALRIARRWNQTGQKFAGDPDIARTFLSSHNLLLWDAVGATYMWNMRCLATSGFSRLPKSLRQIFVPGLIIAAVTFKLAFTNEDAPELIDGLARTIVELTAGIPLVVRARAVFFGLVLATAYTVHFETGPGASSSKYFRPPYKSINVEALQNLHEKYITCFYYS